MNLEKIIANKNKEAVIKNKCQKELEVEKQKQLKDDAKTNREMIKPLLDLFDKSGVKYRDKVHTKQVAFEATYIAVIDRNPSEVFSHNKNQDAINLNIRVDCKKDKPFKCEIYNHCYGNWHSSKDNDTVKRFANLTDMVSYLAEEINSTKAKCKGSVYYQGFDKIFV